MPPIPDSAFRAKIEAKYPNLGTSGYVIHFEEQSCLSVLLHLREQ